MTDPILTKAREIIGEIEGEIELSPKIQLFRGVESLSELERLNSRYGHGLTTGYDELDDMFTFVPQQLYLISAETHVGKTTIALNMCARIASLGEPVLFASLEQGVFIADRVKSMVGRFPDQLSILTSNDMINVKELTDFIYSMEEKPKLVCVDHLHFIKKQGNKTTSDIDTMMIELQNMAKKLEIPVIVIAHVRKLNADRAPTLDDLRDSSSLNQIPSVVLFLHRPKNTGDALRTSILGDVGVLILAKNRIQGKTGVLKFKILPTGAIDIFGEAAEQTSQMAESILGG